MSEQDTKRLFFALWPPAEVRKSWRALFKDSKTPPSVPPQRRHMTLVYLGDMTAEQEKSAREAADVIDSEGFSLLLDRYGCFAKKRVVWMGCQQYCNELQCLVSQLREALQMHKLPVETRKFTPHMTLLRKHRQVPEDWKIPELRWTAHDFVLVHSHRRAEGLCYDLIGRWPLAEMSS